MAETNDSSRAGGWVDPMAEEALGYNYKHKGKMLENVVRKTQKMEAQGFDGDPIAKDKVEASSKQFSLTSSSVGSQLSDSSVLVTAFKGQDESMVPYERWTTGAMLNRSHNKTNGPLVKKTASSRLFEACAANHWNPPLYELCEEGSGHLGKFTYKVTVEVETISSTLLECFGEPRTQKKAAQEHAAEGALWYLNHLRYLPE